MAEVVQFHVEELLAGFKCLEDEGVFKCDEVRTIVKNIQNHEYKMQRSIKEKETGLKYINYLQCVLQLIQKKYDQMNVNINEDVRHMLIKKIKTEFRKLRDRDQRDVKIWLSFINFCKRNNHKDYVSKIYNRMLQVLPDKPELWIIAAKWYLEGQNSWNLARDTFQKGIRFNKSSPELYQLYVEYFRFELLFIEIILKRKKMLSEEESKDEQDPNNALYDQLPVSEIENDNIISGKVAMIVFREATKQVGIKYVLHFFDVLDDFSSYSFSKDLKTEMLDFIKDNYSESEETWNILCKMSTSEQNSFKRFKIADQEYKNALNRFSNERMWTLYLDNLMSNLKENFGTKDEQFYLNKLDEELRICFSVNLISRASFIQIVDQLASLKCAPVYIQGIVKQGLEKWENDLCIWQYFIRSQIQNNVSKVEIKNLFNKLLKIASKNSDQLSDQHSKKTFIDFLKVYVDWTINSLTERELVNTLESNCTVNVSIRDLGLGRIIASYFKSILLEQVSKLNDGSIKRRQMYEKYKLMNPIVKEFFLKMIELEINDLEETGKDSDIKLIRRVYNEMLSQFGKDDHSLWLDFCEFELKYGSYVHISRIYEIAKKSLRSDESDLFVQNYSLLNRKLVDC